MGVVLADRNSRRLIFSIKPKEKEEFVEKKRSLMVRNSCFSWSWILLVNVMYIESDLKVFLYKYLINDGICLWLLSPIISEVTDVNLKIEAEGSTYK